MQLVTLQKVLLPTKPVVGGCFQVVQTHKAHGRWSFTAAEAKGFFKSCHWSYRFRNMVGCFLRVSLLFEGWKTKCLAKVFSMESVANCTHSFLHSSTGLTVGHPRCGAGRVKLGRGSWERADLPPVSSGVAFKFSPPFSVLLECQVRFCGYPASVWAVHHYPGASFMISLFPCKWGMRLVRRGGFAPNSTDSNSPETDFLKRSPG